MQQRQQQEQPKKRPIWKKAAEKLGLSLPVVLMMAKYVLQQADRPILYVCVYMLASRHPSNNPPWTLSFPPLQLDPADQTSQGAPLLRLLG
jgi:hypothetical protein